LSGNCLPAEIVVVDQSQNEATRNSLAQLKNSRVRINYVKQTRRGLSASRNAGILYATHSIIAFTDDDCVPGSEWVSALQEAFASCPKLGGVTGRMLPFGPETPATYSVSERASTARTDFFFKTTPWHVGTGGNTAVRREWFERVGFYDERLGAGSPGKAAEDSELFYRLLSAGGQIRYEPNAVIYHERQNRDESLSRRLSYGHGIGAFCGMCLRAGDVYGAVILCDWLGSLAREMAGYAIRRNKFEVHARLLSFRGTASGLRYGFALAANNRIGGNV
jgi:GT2 family glycosyltransferase